MTLEAEIQRRFVTKCRDAFGLLCIKLNITGRRGWPDTLCLIPGGKPLMIEFKQPGQKPEPLQVHIHTTLRLLGYSVEVHDNVDAAVSAIRAAMEAAQLPEDRSEVPAGARVRRTVP